MNDIDQTNDSLLFTLDDKQADLVNKLLEKANSWNVTNKTRMGLLQKQKFSDGELCVDYTDSVRGKRVYIHSSANTSDAVLLLFLAIDAAKRGAAKEIIPILPYFPYARQDKKDQFRGPIGAKMVAQCMEAAGATAIITLDLHADQIQGFFNIPVTHVEGKFLFVNTFKKLYSENTILCGPDAGSSKRLERFRDLINSRLGYDVPFVMIDKKRKKANEVESMTVIGDVKGKDVIIVDDMVDTAGTLCKGAEALIAVGAKSVTAFITHPVLSGEAYKRIKHSKFTKLYVSDSLSVPERVGITLGGAGSGAMEFVDTSIKIGIVSIAQQFGMAIAAINNHMSFEGLKENERKLEY